MMMDGLRFNHDGLIPVIAQEAGSNEVLMMAWMNAESLRLTLERKEMVYWSRSRQELWHKGATSGHTQKLVSLTADCDGDTLLAVIEQQGAACHTGRKSCFLNPLPTPAKA